MKNILLFILIISFVNCKKRTESTSIEKVKENVVEKKTLKIVNANFLDYLDTDMGFQEDSTDSLRLYAWCCNIKNDSVIFSGKIYLKAKNKGLNGWNNSSERDKIIESINSNLAQNLSSKYNLWAEITHRDFFLPLNNTIDNPCEYYKEDRLISIYSAISNKKWKLIKETKNIDKINNLMK